MKKIDKNDKHNSGNTRRAFLKLSALSAIGPLAFGSNVKAVSSPLGKKKSNIKRTKTIHLRHIPPGKEITVNLFGDPIYVRHRTKQEILESQNVEPTDLIDPYANNRSLHENAIATEANRTVDDDMLFVVVVGWCPFRSCMPIPYEGDFGGWFCPCFGTHYDLAGRVRRGPGLKNLYIPRYSYSSSKILKLYGA